MRIIQIGVGPKKVPLIGYLQDPVPGKEARPSVVILPGGMYQTLSEREGDHVAMQFLARGYHVFLLRYSVFPDAGKLEPLKEASDSLVQIRNHSLEWNCDPTRIALVGFSAGGHLAASLACLFELEEIRVEGRRNRPDAIVLCYPPITMEKNEYAKERRVANVTEGDPRLIHLLSLEEQVTDAHPPCFIWHTWDDRQAPLENTLLYVSALRRHHIPFEYHVYQEGGHGLSTCDKEAGRVNTHAASWLPLCLDWLEARFTCGQV